MKSEIDTFSMYGCCLEINENGDTVTCLYDSDIVHGTIEVDLNKINDASPMRFKKVTFQGFYDMIIEIVSGKIQYERWIAMILQPNCIFCS